MGTGRLKTWPLALPTFRHGIRPIQWLGRYPFKKSDPTNSITNVAGKGMVARAGGAGSVVSYSYMDDTMNDAEEGYNRNFCERHHLY
jgi:hypothetical protein